MLLRRFTDFVLRNRLQAIGLAFVLGFIPIIGGIAILIAALVTLRKGLFEGAVVTLAATLPAWIGVFAFPASATPTAIFASIALVTISNFLTWIFACLLYRFGNWSFILNLAVIVGAIGVGITHWIYPDVQGWWATQLNAYLSKTLSTMNEISGDAAPALTDVQLQLIATIQQYATGLFAVLILFNALLQLVLARWWQAIIFNPGGLRSELHQVRINTVLGVIFVIACILSYFGNEIVIDAMPVFFVGFGIAGLSLVHHLAGLTKIAWLWLIIMYVCIGLLPQVSVVLLALTAFLDIWMDFRKRFRVIER
jgi:hypothetical protein